MIDDDEVRRTSRRLRDVVEPLAANVYFAEEAQSAYRELGLGYIPGYFCSRGACMGQVPGEVVVAAFAVFNPTVVVPAVDEGWSKTDAPTMLAAPASRAPWPRSSASSRAFPKVSNERPSCCDGRARPPPWRATPWLRG